MMMRPVVEGTPAPELDCGRFNQCVSWWPCYERGGARVNDLMRRNGGTFSASPASGWGFVHDQGVATIVDGGESRVRMVDCGPEIAENTGELCISFWTGLHIHSRAFIAKSANGSHDFFVANAGGVPGRLYAQVGSSGVLYAPTGFDIPDDKSAHFVSWVRQRDGNWRWHLDDAVGLTTTSVALSYDPSKPVSLLGYRSAPTVPVPLGGYMADVMIGCRDPGEQALLDMYHPDRRWAHYWQPNIMSQVKLSGVVPPSRAAGPLVGGQPIAGLTQGGLAA